MRSPWILLLVVTPVFAASPCVLDKPVALKGKYPLRDAITLVDARFDRNPVFPVADAYRPDRDTLRLDLFDVEVDERPMMRLGATVQIAGTDHRVGFRKNYEEGTELVGSCGLDDGNVFYANRLEQKMPNGTAVTEVAVSVNEDGNLAMLRLRTPVTESGHWKGAHQDLCLKSAKLAPR